MHELFGNVISVVTRADLIEEGQLVEVPGILARMAGLRLHTAITATAAGETGCAPGQRDNVRRMAVVLELAAAAGRAGGETDRVEFEVPSADPSEAPAALVLHVGPGDDWTPVLTIMLPGED